MTLGERIQDDGVGMRWIRTAATTVTSLLAALALIWGSVLWLFGPRVEDWADALVAGATRDIARDVARADQQLTRLEDIVGALNVSVQQLTEASLVAGSPSWRFSFPDTSITDGSPGGLVRIRAGGYKMRECGTPRVDLYFRSRDGAYHRFEEPSLLTADNRGIALPADPTRLQAVTYTARIPDNAGVAYGRADGYISLTYPDGCPSVPEALVGPLQFRIMNGGPDAPPGTCYEGRGDGCEEAPAP